MAFSNDQGMPTMEIQNKWLLIERMHYDVMIFSYKWHYGNAVGVEDKTGNSNWRIN